jgi:hypothetical protein
MRLWRYVKAHRISLGLVALACLAGQAMTLVGHPGPILSGDSYVYLSDARDIQHVHWPGSGIPPGYSAFLALVNTVTGGFHPGVIVTLQILLLTSSAFLSYLLVLRLSGKVAAATLAGVLLGGDYYLLQWERFVLSEALAAWLVIVMFVLLERCLRGHAARSAVAIGFVCAAAILVHSSMLLIGVPIAAVLVTLRRKARWRNGIAVFSSSYGLLAVVAILNGLNTGHYVLSATADGNLRGKIIEYQMQEAPSDPRYSAIKAALRNETQPIGAYDRHPELSTTPRKRLLLDSYVQDIFRSHLSEFATLGLRDAVFTWIAEPLAYGQPASATVDIARLTATANQAIAATLPLAGLMALWSIRSGRRKQGWTIAAMGAVAAAVFLIVGLDGYTEQTRLRSPVDGLVRLAVIVAATELVVMMRRRHDRRFRSAGHT